MCHNHAPRNKIRFRTSPLCCSANRCSLPHSHAMGFLHCALVQDSLHMQQHLLTEAIAMLMPLREHKTQAQRVVERRHLDGVAVTCEQRGHETKEKPNMSKQQISSNTKHHLTRRQQSCRTGQWNGCDSQLQLASTMIGSSKAYR